MQITKGKQEAHPDARVENKQNMEKYNVGTRVRSFQLKLQLITI